MVFALLALSSLMAPVDCTHLPPAVAAPATMNDNRRSVGRLIDGVLTVRLVTRRATWRPDGPKGCALEVNAFAEEGGTASIPGPMIRVPVGTRVRVELRNTLASRIWVEGLQDRLGGVLTSTEVGAGEARTIEFVARAPGAWYYSGASVADRPTRSNADGQFVGALVVDPADRPSPDDRVLMLTRWSASGTFLETPEFQLNAFNGRSWPNTERLSHTVGDSVRWTVINASNSIHEMHLHGFFFRIDRKGGEIDSGGRNPATNGTRVTAAVRPGEWMSIAFSPDRPGNWLYHCHIISHMSAAQRLDRVGSGSASATHEGHGGGNHAMDDMAGLVIGLDVRPSGRAERSAAAPSGPRREIALYTAQRPGVFGTHDAYSFIVKEGDTVPARDSLRIPGTPIVVTRDEPVQVTVHNRFSFPIAVHWHGLELESYYDGVAGFSGLGRQVTPMIAPGDSFVVHFTPPRAGTYMYHIHGETGEQLASGLYGSLVVLEPGRRFDAEREQRIVVGDAGPGNSKAPRVNGALTPDTLQFVVGRTYLLRFHVITSEEVYQHSITGPAGLVSARQVAADGHPVTEGPVVSRPIRFPLGPGHTQDWEFTPEVAGDYTVSFERISYATGLAVMTGTGARLPIRVR